MVQGEGGHGHGRSGLKATATDERKDNPTDKKEAGKTTGKWFSSTVSVANDFLPPWEVLQWRKTGVEAIPTPAGKKRVLHQQFFCRGCTRTSELFRYYFQVKVEKNGDDICNLGGSNLQLQPVSDYFKITLAKSVREWHKVCFYSSGLTKICRPSSMRHPSVSNPGSR
ncbi:hypothetical protein ZWY2020_008544 [Hordeum vulgare]|nr:hypothetical protein ZWY2020_008544 [Hordeum vulgare]